MKTFILAAILLMSTFSYSQVVKPSAPDTLILRSGEIAAVEIIDREKGDIRYIKIGDETNIRRTPVRMFKEIIEHSFAEQKFARNEDGKIVYGEVVEVEDLSKDNIFNLTKLLIADEYREAEEATELEDKELGIILVEGWFPVTAYYLGYPSVYQLWHSLKIEMKDGRYRYHIYNFRIQPQGDTQSRVSAELTFFEDEAKVPASISKIREQIKDGMLKGILGLSETVKKRIVPPSKDDKW